MQSDAALYVAWGAVAIGLAFLLPHFILSWAEDQIDRRETYECEDWSEYGRQRP